jgi:hypothetical protein
MPNKDKTRADRRPIAFELAASQRDEIASSQLIELHSIRASQGRIAGYRIGRDQSAGRIEVAQHRCR